MSHDTARPEESGVAPRGVRVAVDGRCATLTLDAPALNILGFGLISALRDALKAIRSRGVTIAVIQSGIAGVFSAGVDVKIHAPELAPRMLRAVHRVIRRILDADTVFIAEVDGICLGGGFELALACDFVIASPQSQFGFPEIDLACFPPVAAVLLPRLAPAAASSLILTGRRFDAREGHRLGLVTEVDDDASAATRRLVETLASKSGHALVQARRALHVGRRGAVSSALDRTERLYERKITPSADAAEGVSAFVQKRAPRWRNE